MTQEPERQAACACGRLSIRLRGEPRLVSSCCCQQCQRRTGSFFGVTAFFAREQLVETCGEATSFRRTGDSGGAITFHFCPHCGSTVWWDPEARPGLVSVAGGAFADAHFPPPQRMVWTEHRHPWVCTPEELALFEQNPG